LIFKKKFLHLQPVSEEFSWDLEVQKHSVGSFIKKTKFLFGCYKKGFTFAAA
jgi:hypothetical protein